MTKRIAFEDMNQGTAPATGGLALTPLVIEGLEDFKGSFDRLCLRAGTAAIEAMLAADAGAARQDGGTSDGSSSRPSAAQEPQPAGGARTSKDGDRAPVQRSGGEGLAGDAGARPDGVREADANVRGGETGSSRAEAADAGGDVEARESGGEADRDKARQQKGERGDASGGSTLYSGIDPAAIRDIIGKPLLRAVKNEVDKATKDAAQVRALLKSSPGTGAIVQYLKNFGAMLTFSNRGVMHMLRDRYTGKASEIISEIADHIATDPGSGRLVKTPYEWAVNQKTYSWMNRMANIVGDDRIGDAKLGEEVGDILAGRAGRFSEAARKIAGRVRGLMDEAHKHMTEAGVEVGYRKDYFPRQLDHQTVMADVDGFERDAAAVYRKMGLGTKEAAEAARDWRDREMGLGSVKHLLPGPRSDFTKGRVLPPETDQMMAKWYQRDAFETLSGYFRQAARIAEFTRRFGKSGTKLDEMFDAARREGVAEADLALLRKSVDSSLGLINGAANSAVTTATSWIQTIGMMRMLPRAVWASFAEPLAYGVRTGNAADGLRAFGLALGDVFGSKRLDDQRDAAEFLGVVGDAMTHMLLAGQFGGGQASKLNNALLARFFNRSGLQPLTEAQRLAGMRIGQDFIGRLLRDAQGGNRQKSSLEMLADLGIGKDDVAALSKWLGKAGGAPKVSDLIKDSPASRMYGSAILRFIDESILNPKAIDRPILANHPVGRLAFGIMSFMFTYTRNVLIRTGKQGIRAVTGKGYTAADRAAMALGPGFALIVLSTVQAGVAALRDTMTNPDEAKTRPTELSAMQYVSRAGLMGNLDPVVNGVLGLKYESSLLRLIAGPYVGQLFQDLDTFGGLIPPPIGRNSPTTNTAEWNASRAAYNTIGVPLIAAGLSLAPGGPVLNKGYGVLIASPLGGNVTAPLSPQAASDFATAVAGERPKRWGAAAGGKSKFGGKFD